MCNLWPRSPEGCKALAAGAVVGSGCGLCIAFTSSDLEISMEMANHVMAVGPDLPTEGPPNQKEQKWGVRCLSPLGSQEPA